MSTTTIVTTVETMAYNLRSSMMERLYTDMDMMDITEFCDETKSMTTDLRALTSPNNQIAHEKTQELLAQGFVDMMLNPDDADQAHTCVNNDTPFRIAVFRDDGSAVCVINGDDVCV